MPKIGTMATRVGFVIVGVIAAGLIMNALRGTDFFRMAINGFDS